MSDAEPVEGVDYAFPPIPSAAALTAAGKRFVCRYGGPGSASKQLTATERDQLHAAGIAIVANAEGAAGGLLDGWSAGVAWAKSADAYFSRLGLPKDRPIYLSVDFDATDAQLKGPISDALLGAASVIGSARVGVYGGYRTIGHAAANGTAHWFWQTYGWSGGRWHPKAHIQQYKNGVRIGGADCDLNRAMVADYGQWTGADMALTDDDIKKLLGFSFGSSSLGIPSKPLQDWLKGGEAARQEVTKLAAKVDQLETAQPIVTDDQLERVLRKVLGGVDGASPPVAG